MKWNLHILTLAVLISLFACTDWRMDAFEDKRFDPNQAFIRFNYDYSLNQGATDSLVLDVSNLADTTVIRVPIAWSREASADTLQLTILRTLSTESDAMQVAWPDGQNMEEEATLEFLPDEYERDMLVRITEPEVGVIVFDMVENNQNIIMGFPGSNRHSNFKIRLQ